jgi:hypothetical protein
MAGSVLGNGGDEVLRMITRVYSELRRLNARVGHVEERIALVVRAALRGDDPHDAIGEALRPRVEPYWGQIKAWRACGKTRVCVRRAGDPEGAVACTSAQWSVCEKVLEAVKHRAHLLEVVRTRGYSVTELQDMTRKELYQVAGVLGLSPFKTPVIQESRQAMLAAIIAAQRALRRSTPEAVRGRRPVTGTAPAPVAGREPDRRSALLARRRAQRVVAT